MATTNRWKLFQVVHGSTVIPGIQSSDFQSGIEQFSLGGDGAIDRTASGVRAVRPVAEFDTVAIRAALDITGITGVRLSFAGNKLDLYYAKCDRLGIMSGSVHTKVTINNGILVPTAVRASQFQDATIHYVVHTEYDGTNNPYTIAVNQALPTQAINVQVFTLGKVVLNGSALDGVQSFDIDFGNNVNVTGDQGHLYPTFTGISDRESKITVNVLDIMQLNTLGISGTPQGATDSLFYLRKRTPHGGLVADATLEHISFKLDEGNISPGNITEADGVASIPIMIQPVWDGTNNLLVIDTATAIA